MPHACAHELGAFVPGKYTVFAVFDNVNPVTLLHTVKENQLIRTLNRLLGLIQKVFNID